MSAFLQIDGVEKRWGGADDVRVGPISLGIERSFAYLKGGGEDARLGSLLLSGGGSQMPRLRKHLAQRHEVPVEVIDPLRTISYDPEVFSGQPVEKTAPLLAVSVGLGLRRVE